jgi:hypothetical protein
MDLAKLHADMEEGSLDAANQAIADYLTSKQKKSEKKSERKERDSSATAIPTGKGTPRAKRLSKTANKSLGTMDVTGKYQGKGFTITGCGPSEGRKPSS